MRVSVTFIEINKYDKRGYMVNLKNISILRGTTTIIIFRPR